MSWARLREGCLVGDLGKEIDTVIVEPVETPVPVPAPPPQPEPIKEPVGV
ncbi:MAG: hypothetical protein M3454_00850 [Actinomycetota bacterium]|nr:hypothetical protein [Actinomycetota bacterium]